MAESKMRDKNKLLIWILVVLVVIAVGISIGILVINLLNSGTQNSDEDHTYPNSMHTTEFEEINELAADMPMEEAKKLYEDAIIAADTEENAMEARVEYGRYLLFNNEIDSFTEQFEHVDEEALDSGYKILYYSALRWYYDLIDKEDLSEEYNEKIRIVVKNSDYAAGG